mmetsp:Transcript_13337/g.28522  ORF Transcript_13337/g.28522 Transcript_13337/m.28522 type:complete len:150 (-) Transcript_13337:1103-1552(-)
MHTSHTNTRCQIIMMHDAQKGPNRLLTEYHKYTQYVTDVTDTSVTSLFGSTTVLSTTSIAVHPVDVHVSHQPASCLAQSYVAAQRVYLYSGACCMWGGAEGAAGGPPGGRGGAEGPAPAPAPLSKSSLLPPPTDAVMVGGGTYRSEPPA